MSDQQRATMTRKQVIAAIVANHLRANIDIFEDDPKQWGRPVWSKAWLDGRGAYLYLHVPIKGGVWNGTEQRVYPPARLRLKLANLYALPSTPEGSTR